MKPALYLTACIILLSIILTFSCDNADQADSTDDSGNNTKNDDPVDDDSGNDDDDDDDDDDNDDDDNDFDPGIFWAEDFETLDIGPLPPPWSVTENNATVQVDKELFDSNQVLKINDISLEKGDGCSAFVDLSEYPQLSVPIEFSYDTQLMLGIVVGFAAMIKDKNDKIIPAFYIDLEFLSVAALGKYNGREVCVNLFPFDWHQTMVQIDQANNTFSVWVDDEETACQDMVFIEPSEELVGFKFFGYDGERWFGSCYFDNLTAAVP